MSAKSTFAPLISQRQIWGIHLYENLYEYHVCSYRIQKSYKKAHRHQKEIHCIDVQICTILKYNKLFLITCIWSVNTNILTNLSISWFEMITRISFFQSQYIEEGEIIYQNWQDYSWDYNHHHVHRYR